MKDFLIKRLGYWIVDPEVLHAYRTAIPSRLTFKEEKVDGKIIIRITSINDTPIDEKTLLTTQADKPADVVPMVNDLIMTYKDIPFAFRKYFEKDLILDGHTKSQKVMVKA